jgi:hypothetical protein
MTVSLRGKLPGGDANGLGLHETYLREHPDEYVTIVVKATVKKRTENIGDENNPWTIELGVSAIELVRGGDEQFIDACLRQAYEARTGKQSLAFGADVTDNG